MSLWLRAYLTRPASVTTKQLSHALDDADFYMMMAENQNLDDELGPITEKSLRFVEETRNSDCWVVLVRYRHHKNGDRHMRFEVWGDAARVKEEVDEALEQKLPARAKKLLPKVVASAAFELKVSDAEGMGWPIAYHLAMWLAAPERGAGLVEYEGDWWDPKTYKRLS